MSKSLEAIILAAALALASSTARAQEVAGDAAAGEAVFRACAACHGARFDPAPGSPPLKGAAFLTNWRGRTLAELQTKIRTMPPGAAESLPAADYLAVMAYLLETNGFPAGEALPMDEAALREIGFGE